MAVLRNPILSIKLTIPVPKSNINFINPEFNVFWYKLSNVALNLSNLACVDSWYIANFSSAVPAEFKAAS